MARLVDYLIEDVRDSSENQDFSDTTGIQDREFLRYLNDAQYRIVSKIINKHPSVFIEEYTQDIVSGQENYSIPMTAHMGNKITQVEYSVNGDPTNYGVLKKTFLSNRASGYYAGLVAGYPTHYIRKAGEILLKPVPTRGVLRVNYTKRMPRLDKRRGSVASVTIVDDVITSLFLDVATDVVDADTLNKNSRFSIVGAEGDVKAKNVLFTSINASSGEVIIPATFTLDDGDTIEVGDYILSGPYSSTHTELDEMVERYLIEYAVMKILERDSNTDIQIQLAILQEIETDILSSYSDMSDDITEIPNINNQTFDW